MADGGVRAVVYDPPSSGFPYLVVVFYENDVIGSLPAPSAAAADAFLTEVMSEFTAKVAAD